MAYTRKTYDEYQLHVKYPGPQGWEHELTESTYTDIKARRQEYRDNCPEYPVKIVIKRCPLHQT